MKEHKPENHKPETHNKPEKPDLNNNIIDVSGDDISENNTKKNETKLSLSKDELDLINQEISDETCKDIVKEFMKIEKCSILKFGIKTSDEKVRYGFCQTCDVNLMHPICLECLSICHKSIGHKTREIHDPGYIKCGCGKRMHKIKLLHRNSRLVISRECPYSDWCEKSRLSTLYVIDGKCVCEFCYRMCGYEGKGKPLEKEKEMLQVCECEELNGCFTHTDLKKLYKKFEDILNVKNDSVMGLDHTQFLNLLFLGKSSYEALFSNFEEMIESFYALNANNKLNIKENFASTNFYLSLNVFCKIIEKSKKSILRYFSQELANKFSFKLINNLIDNIIFKDTPIFWNFLSEMLYLYKKITIGNITMNMDKYKLNDLVNFSPILRKCVTITNTSLFQNAPHQIAFFIKCLDNILKQEIRLEEAFDVFIQICGIIKRLSGFYLINNVNMTRFCFATEEMFEYFKTQNCVKKQVELFYILIKMFNYFIYIYNDNIIYNYITEHKKVDLSKIKLLFYKNELGRLISRNTIRIMYYVLTVTKHNVLTKKEKSRCSGIIELGSRILSLMLTEKETYFMTYAENCMHNYNLFQIIFIPPNSLKLIQLFNEIHEIENIYSKYYSFDADRRDVIREVYNSLEKVMNLARNGELRPYITKTNYFFILCKILFIIKEKKDEEEEEEHELIKRIVSNIFVFLHYYIENNYDNCLLICSHYIVNALITAPDEYALDIFKLYSKCSDIIAKNRGLMQNPLPLIQILFDYLLKYKKNSKEKWEKEAQDFFLEGVVILDEVVYFFLTILIKFFLQMKLLLGTLCRIRIKNILISFLQNFEFVNLISYNAYLVIILVNKIIDSTNQNDRDIILKLIPFQNITTFLDDTNLDVDFRTEILIFIKSFKCSLCFRQKDNFSKKAINSIGKGGEETIINNKINVNKSSEDKIVINTDKKKRQLRHKTKKKNYGTNKGIVHVNINTLFQINNEEKIKNNNYLNAIGQDSDVFLFIKNNPLVVNMQYPTKYLSFNYFLLKNEDIDSVFKTVEQTILIFEKELKIFKDVYEKNSNNINKVFKYLVKGIILPLCAILKLVFCFTCDCTGYNLLMLSQIIIKMLYIKNFIMDSGNSFLNERKYVKFDNFDLSKFLCKETYNDTIEDFFTLKERKYSPYDFTYVWGIFQKHFLQYIIYPESSHLEDEFPKKEIGYISYGKISEETDVLEEMRINLSKKSGNSLSKKKDKLKSSVGVILAQQTKEKELKSENMYSAYTLTSNNKDIDTVLIGDTEDEKREYLNKKFKTIIEFYCNEKINIKEENSSLLGSLPELCAEYEVNFRKMLLCILVNLPGEGGEYESVCFIIIYKIFLLSTSESQNDLIDNMGGRSVKDLGFLINLSNAMYKSIIKYFIDDFNIDFVRYKYLDYRIFCIAKILKLLCEEHNSFFQEKLLCSLEYFFLRFEDCQMTSTVKSKFFETSQNFIQFNNTIEDSMSFFNFMINTLHKLLIITDKAQAKGHSGFVYDVYYSIIELLVEMIQGNKKEILIKGKGDEMHSRNSMSLFSFKTFVSLNAEVLFNDSLLSGPGFRTRLLLISFFIAILEEKNNEEIQKIIIKFLSINKVLSSIIFTMKHYFYEHTKDDPKFKEYYADYDEKHIIQKEFIFDHNVYSYYTYHYFHSDVSKESKEFELANNYYKYIKKLSINNKCPEAKDLIKSIEKLSETEAKKKFALFNKKVIKHNDVAPINLTNEKEKSISLQFIERYYTIKFFENITKVVEIRLPQEHRNVSVIFTVPCEMIHLTQMTKEEFVYGVDRSNETSKKCELVRSIPLFQLEIEYFKNTKVGCLSKLILNIDYIYIQIIMYLYAVIFLIIMLFTLEGYEKIEADTSSEEEERRRRLDTITRYLIQIPKKVQDSIDESINKWGIIYDLINYIFTALNGFFILSWVAVKMPLYYILDKFVYMDEKKIQKEEDLSFLNKAYICFINTLIGRDYISSLLYMFIISLIGSIMERGEIVYAFYLLAVLDLNQTLKGIALSIKVRGPELGASFLLLIFLVYFYSNIGFFFLNDNFAADIENDIPDNYCLCLSFCFFTNFDAGIRARGGAADQMVRISYERNTTRYVVRLIYDVTYFIICIIIMIDLVFGIILGTFSEMREEERKHDDDKINHCFLCHVTREVIEKKREDFQVHRNKKHYLWNYVEYMIYLKFANVHELSASNSFARNNLDKKNICFLPSCQDDYDKGINDKKEIIEKKDVKQAENSSENSSDEENSENSDESDLIQASNKDDGDTRNEEEDEDKLITK